MASLGDMPPPAKTRRHVGRQPIKAVPARVHDTTREVARATAAEHQRKGKTSSRRRSITIIACFNCQRRKSKCDGQRPFCNPCSKNTSLGGCHYELPCDFKRSAYLRKLIADTAQEHVELQEIIRLMNAPTNPYTAVLHHEITKLRSRQFENMTAAISRITRLCNRDPTEDCVSLQSSHGKILQIREDDRRRFDASEGTPTIPLANSLGFNLNLVESGVDFVACSSDKAEGDIAVFTLSTSQPYLQQTNTSSEDHWSHRQSPHSFIAERLAWSMPSTPRIGNPSPLFEDPPFIVSPPPYDTEWAMMHRQSYAEHQDHGLVSYEQSRQLFDYSCWQSDYAFVANVDRHPHLSVLSHPIKSISWADQEFDHLQTYWALQAPLDSNVKPMLRVRDWGVPRPSLNYDLYATPLSGSPLYVKHSSAWDLDPQLPLHQHQPADGLMPLALS